MRCVCGNRWGIRVHWAFTGEVDCFVPACATDFPPRLLAGRKEMIGIPPDIYNRLLTVLLECGPFSSDSELGSVFVDARLSPWRYGLPQVNNPGQRVRATVASLSSRYNSSQENALVLLLCVLSESVSPHDACHRKLAKLAEELDSYFHSQRPGEPSLPSTETWKRDRYPPAIKILFLAANPRDTLPLRLGEEMRAIEQVLRQSDLRDRFDVEQHWAVRTLDLQNYLLQHQPHIVHFSGHGSRGNEILLEGVTGNAHFVSARALGRLFSVLKDNLRCVVLNACYSEKQANIIAQYIDCVIGMSKAIGDLAAINFSSAFYQSLGYGRDVKTAFDLGCVQIDLAGLDEQDIPKLIAVRSDPARIVFAGKKRPR